MQKLAFILLFFSFIASDHTKQKLVGDKVPAMFKGNFVDDYGIRYTVNDTLFMQLPRTKYHIIKWNVKDQYIVPVMTIKTPARAACTPV